MKRTVGFLAALVLAGCATTGTEMQAQCEARYSAFSDIYRCTRGAVATGNPGILKDPRAKLYLLRGEQLAEQVDAGQISSLDAKVSWQQLYVELKAANDQEVASSLAALSRSSDAMRAAVAVPASVACTSNKVGSTVYTNCR